MGKEKYNKLVLLVVVIALSVLAYDLINTQEVDVDPENDISFADPIIVPVDLDRLEQKITFSSSEINEGKILPIVSLSTNSCPPCVNNIIDFYHLTADHDTFLDIVLVFSNEDEESVERFLKIRSIDIPYMIMNSSEKVEFFSDLPQDLIFIDYKHQQAFLNFEIPNINTSLEFKTSILKDGIELWRKRYKLQ